MEFTPKFNNKTYQILFRDLAKHEKFNTKQIWEDEKLNNKLQLKNMIPSNFHKSNKHKNYKNVPNCSTNLRKIQKQNDYPKTPLFSGSNNRNPPL